MCILKYKYICINNIQVLVMKETYAENKPISIRHRQHSHKRYQIISPLFVNKTTTTYFDTFTVYMKNYQYNRKACQVAVKYINETFVEQKHVKKSKNQ